MSFQQNKKISKIRPDIGFGLFRALFPLPSARENGANFQLQRKNFDTNTIKIPTEITVL